MITGMAGRDFDRRLAIECADALAHTSSLGCMISSTDGKAIHSTGFSCANCQMCSAIGIAPDSCLAAQGYATISAERFGGKYEYFCPGGLTCFTTPIFGESGIVARITMGPFLMTEKADYIRYDLCETHGLSGARLDACKKVLEDVPQVSAKRVYYISNLLFMSAGFVNNVSAASHMVEAQMENEIQGQISDYILRLKQGATDYPYETEKELMHSIATSNRDDAQRLLNLLLGNILLASGGELSTIKTRINELLVLMSRAAVDGGADMEYTLRLNQRYIIQLQTMQDLDKLCLWLTSVMNSFIDNAFRFSGFKHFDIMHKTLAYLRAHYAEKLSLEDMARSVYLSPSYFAKIFKEEQGCTFREYLTAYRIEKSKALLLNKSIRIADISAMVGFEDQSYFTKVFKRIVGTSPNKFRESNGRMRREQP